MADTLERLQLLLGDRYEFVRELGRGGMATVFLAKDLKHERDVAVKVLHPDLAASIGGERFEREIRVAAKLQHPHILGMYDSGNADGLLYYVMPFIEGESLRDKIDREGQLPVEDAIRIALEVSDALGYAHKQNIVHRDIKPENVLLNDGRALVADFGIARAVEEGTQKLTQTGMALGTPTYMAPEQAMGEKVGATADIYSLGCMLFEMLSGEPPFSGKNASAIMAKHVMEQVPSIRIVRQSVPEEIELAIFAAMGKSPADRPQSCADFSELLLAMPSGHTSTRLMTMRHTTARRTPGAMTATYQVEALPVPFWKRPVVMVPLVLALVGGALAATKFLGNKPAASTAVARLNPKSVAILYLTAQNGGDSLATLAEGLTETLIENLGTVSEISVISAGGVAPFRNAETSVVEIAEALQVGTIVRGTVEQVGDSIRVAIRLVDGNSGVDHDNGTRTFAVDARSFTALRDSTVSEVSDLVRRVVGTEFALRQQRQGTTNNEAWLLLQRAERLRKRAAASKDSALALRAEADAMLAEAERLDAKWPDPIIARARLAYETSRRTQDPLEARGPIEIGLAHIERALALAPNDATALELRGNLRYWRFLTKVDATDAVRTEFLANARADLEKATTINRNQAGAWASLSHLLYYVDDVDQRDIYEAAKKAWAADAFLATAQTVLNRLFLAAYDLERWPDAEQWCTEMQRRFAASPQAPRCQLFLFTTRARTPDIARAWQLADSIARIVPPAQQPFERRKSDLLVAAVIARAGNLDSAAAVAERARGTPEVDPNNELPQYAAYVAVLRSDTTAALKELKSFLSDDEDRRKAQRSNPNWWFRPLVPLPEFKRLIGSEA